MGRRSKYGAVRTTIDGITFASKAEARRYQELRLMELAGGIRHLSMQVPFTLKVNGEAVCRYVADFTYYKTPANGSVNSDAVSGLPDYVVEDVKGAPLTPVYRLKAKLMKAIHGIDIRVTR